MSIRVAFYPEIIRSGVSFPRLQEFAQLYCSSNAYYNVACQIRGVHSGCDLPRDYTIRGVFSQVGGICSVVLYCSSNAYYNVARFGVSIRVAIYPEIVRSGVSFPRLQEFSQLYCSSKAYYDVARFGVSIRVANYPEIVRSLGSGVSFPRLQEFVLSCTVAAHIL